jgi:hypothetical protein
MAAIPPQRAAVLALLCVCAAGPAQPADALRNWFGDPFFQISAALADCPLPAGPFVDETEKRVAAHHRAEKGTTCWLAKECDRPNAYAYDADIAAAFQQALRDSGGVPDSSLWVTVQGRVIYVEGCARDEAVVARVEALARSVPYVQQALAIIRTDARAQPPYRLRGPQ